MDNKPARWAALAALLAAVVALYAALALVNLHSPALEAVEGAVHLEDDLPQSGPCILTGQWEAAPGLYAPDTAQDAPFALVDVAHMGDMGAHTYRLLLWTDGSSSLYFTLARPRGSRLWIDNVEVLDREGASPQADQVFALDDYVQGAGAVSLLLQVPVNQYFYSGYQGLLLGGYGQLFRVGQCRLLVEAACLGACLVLLIICLALYAQKRSEKYILVLALLIVLTGLRLADYSARIGPWLFPKGSGDFYRLAIFARYALCAHFAGAGRRKWMDWAVGACAGAALAAFVLAHGYFAQLCDWFNLVCLALEGALLLGGVLRGERGALTIAVGWGLYLGMEAFYRLLSAGIIPQGLVDVLVKPMQYAHIAYMLSFSVAVCGKFARKYSEADALAAGLEAKVNEQVEEIRSCSQRIVDEQRLRQRFMTDLIHNLRNPLFALGGYMDLLEDEMADNTPSQREYIDLINGKLAYLNRMVDEMLLISRLESGQISFKKTNVDLAGLLRGVAADALANHKCAGDMVQVDCPAMVAPGDQFRLKQALDNLVDNALLHGQGPVRLSACRKGDQVQILVEDWGVGIPSQDLPHVFDRYYHSGKEKSVGLGLPIAREIIRHQGGHIELESQLGKGTKVRLFLPL